MKYIRNKSFPNKNQTLCISRGYLEQQTDGNVNNCCREFVIEPRTYQKRRQQRQWVRPWIRKRDSKGSNYSIINNPRLTDKENFRK